ncbi:MAG: ROK family protein [Candidatus Acididesulfobacter guangdongensis]|uniref:ROK family protein n=1 Tax=Acididesulfobacter guangdongensis TaxID=2597225 RepID=A0A519BHQ1_ACIG2|nr:MAG: ROK family protein [Candidatus Acididesulfobacter guangdongensis]
MNKNIDKIGQYLGIDIGGTNIRFGMVDARGRLLSFNSMPIEQSADKAIGQIKTFIKRLIEQRKDYDTKNTGIKNIKAVGIAAAGQIDRRSGVIIYSPNLNWRNVRIKEELENLFNTPVFIENDVNAIAYGEWKTGAGKGFKNLVCIFIGTGIGSGLIINNRLIEGCNGSAGEIGHAVIVSGGRKCHCGNNGCFEAYAGGWGIAEIAVEKAVRNPEKYKMLIELSSGGVNNISSESISKAYMLEDEAAKELVHITAGYIADGIISVVNLLNPCMIVLGGGVIDGIPDLVEIAEKEIRKRALKVSVDSLKIIKSEFGESAGLIGAAMVAKSQIK